MSGFKVIKPGFLSTVQDSGRTGYQQYGLSPSGCMDDYAYRWGNHLLQNSSNAACLEITFGQCQLLALADTEITVTGAVVECTINQSPAPLWQTIKITEGDILSLGKVSSGVRNYLCVHGGFQTKKKFGSRATSLREQIGAVIQTNDILPCKAYPQTTATRSTRFIPDYQAPLILRVLPGYQYQQFGNAQRQQFFSQTYSISQHADRAAYQLQGEPLANIPKTMTSEGMGIGAIQITQAGLPIVMMKEHPTIGGYPKIGSVLSLDLAKLAQRQSGVAVEFQKISHSSAQSILLKAKEYFSEPSS